MEYILILTLMGSAPGYVLTKKELGRFETPQQFNAAYLANVNKPGELSCLKYNQGKEEPCYVIKNNKGVIYPYENIQPKSTLTIEVK